MFDIDLSPKFLELGDITETSAVIRVNYNGIEWWKEELKPFEGEMRVNFKLKKIIS